MTRAGKKPQPSGRGAQPSPVKEPRPAFRLKRRGSEPPDWPRMFDELLREIPIATVATMLATAMTDAARMVEKKCAAWLDEQPGMVFRLEDWLATWQFAPEPYYHYSLLDGLHDLARGAPKSLGDRVGKIARHGEGPTAALWFLSLAVDRWQTTRDHVEIADQQARWLVSAVGCGRDPVAGIFLALFEEFRAKGCFETVPVPPALNDGRIRLSFGNDELFVATVPLVTTMAKLASARHDLGAALGPGIEWADAAANIRIARMHGLVWPTDYMLTEVGHARFDRYLHGPNAGSVTWAFE
jgi:hypothetical protein